MKEYFLLKARFNEEFYLDEGFYASNRVNLGQDKKNILKYLKKEIKLKRNSMLHILKGSFNESYLEDILEFFSGSKVEIKLEDKFD